VQPTIDFIRSDAKEETPTEDQNLIVSLLRIMRALMKMFDNEDTFNSYDKKQIQ